MTIKKKSLFGIILLILVTSGILLFRFYRQPLGPALELPTSTQPVSTFTIIPIQETEISSTATEVQPTNTATPQP